MIFIDSRRLDDIHDWQEIKSSCPHAFRVFWKCQKCECEVIMPAGEIPHPHLYVQHMTCSEWALLPIQRMMTQ